MELLDISFNYILECGLLGYDTTYSYMFASVRNKPAVFMYRVQIWRFLRDAGYSVIPI
jgi:hypothetical protein